MTYLGVADKISHYLTVAVKIIDTVLTDDSKKKFSGIAENAKDSTEAIKLATETLRKETKDSIALFLDIVEPALNEAGIEIKRPKTRSISKQRQALVKKIRGQIEKEM